MPDDNEVALQLLNNPSLSRQEQAEILERLVLSNPGLIKSICLDLNSRNRQLKQAVEQANGAAQGLKGIIEKLSETPWPTGTVVRLTPNIPDKAVVAVGRSLALMGYGEDIDPAEVRVGRRVFVSNERNVVVGLDLGTNHCGELGVVDYLLGNMAALKVREVDHIIVAMSQDLIDTPPKKGDTVMFDRELMMAFSVIQKPEGDEETILEDLDTSVTLAQIGGLDDVKTAICDELTLQAKGHDIVVRHELRTARGIVLVGPPGNGKSMLCKALANFVRELTPNGEVKCVSMPPGAHRHPHYGMSDRIIINTFKQAREFASKPGNRCVIIMDEIDNWGKRSESIGNMIDSRVMNTLLTQIDGLEDSSDILIIATSNRAHDLVDNALIRPGRLGDKIFNIPRPNREAARSIFEKYLSPHLPYFDDERGLTGEEAAAELIDTALAHIYSPNGGANTVATLLMRDATRQPVTAQQIMSGAMIENIVRKAKECSCVRGLTGQEGITREDLLDAIDEELENASRPLRSPHNAREILELSPDLDFRVDLTSNRREMRIDAYQAVRA
ncbi:MAG: AAA family ATPase [Nitrospiraceae bacterium]|nr:AAA family ATPase [Nitrospiraceae bacterium]